MKKIYWLWASPITASPDCFESLDELYERAEVYLKAWQKNGVVDYDSTEYIEDEEHINYRLIVE